jgi:membrane associated rhomboid family serine protease
LISWVVTIFLIGLVFRSLRTDNMAHLGGLATGFVLGKIFADRLPQPGAERTRAYLLGWLGGLAIAVCFALALLNYRTVLP